MQKQVDLYGFKISLANKVSSRLAKATYQDFAWKQEKGRQKYDFPNTEKTSIFLRFITLKMTKTTTE